MVILGKVELRETQTFAGESYDLLPNNIRRVEKVWMGWNSYRLVAIEADDTRKGLLNYYTFVSFEIFQEYFFNSNNSDMNTNFRVSEEQFLKQCC